MNQTIVIAAPENICTVRRGRIYNHPEAEHPRAKALWENYLPAIRVAGKDFVSNVNGMSGKFL